MKKRIIAMVLVAAFALAFTIPAYASSKGSSLSADDIVSNDAAVQAVYVQYVNMVNALETKDYDVIEAAYYAFYDLCSKLTEAQEDEWWDTVVEEKIGDDTVYSAVTEAGFTVYTVTLMKTYKQNPNVSTAYEFVSAYDYCEYLGIDINAVHGDVKIWYDTAKTYDMPSDNAIAVYEAYLEVIYALESEDPDNFDEAIEEFSAVVDIYNELEASEFTDIAYLLDIESEDPELTDGEYIAQIIFADWFDINILDSIDKVYDDFTGDSNTANAEALVEFYNLVFPQDGEDDYISYELALAFFPDLTEVYEQAKVLLSESDSSDTEQSESSDTEGSESSDVEQSESSDTEGSESSDIEQSEASGGEGSSSPDTSDGFGTQIWLVVALLSALAVGLASKRKTN